jgi:hypothetical protein
VATCGCWRFPKRKAQLWPNRPRSSVPTRYADDGSPYANRRRVARRRVEKDFIEIALIKAIDARNAVSIDAVLKQLNALRGENGGVMPSASAAAPAVAPRPAAATPAAIPPRAPQPVAATTTLPTAQPAAVPVTANADLDVLWRNLVEAIGRASAFARSYFLEAHPVSFAKNVLTIGFDPEFADHISMVDNAKNHALIATKLAELGHPGAQVKIVQAERPEAYAAPQEPVQDDTPPVPVAATPVASTVQQTTAPVAKTAPAPDQRRRPKSIRTNSKMIR